MFRFWWGTLRGQRATIDMSFLCDECFERVQALQEAHGYISRFEACALCAPWLRALYMEYARRPKEIHDEERWHG